ncbi:diguanylate cyclase [Halovulum dunhuangense]|uniref:diguanylate cyclase n=1 Tax=Halovulum dunhuangense TaxID=1505036 RepID=A0A849L0G2_9RHOB|nr:diguanylate cyclase [Halovulum dunhuangense]NNU79756.1 diguanylate cyclase [Halovulum dunhuangense]
MHSETRPQLIGDSLYPQVGGDQIAARAIGFAQTHDTALTPAVYEVWYVYAARSCAAVNQALDRAMNTGQAIRTDWLTTLYHDHLCPTAADESLSAIGADLQRTIGRMTDAMDENIREHGAFSGTLRTARNSLMQGTSKREVTDVIRELHRANQSQLLATQRLQLQLEKSRAQVAKLRSELIETRRLSNTDYLTGLPNRRMLDEHLDDAIFRARQRGLSLTVLMAGIDGLDQVSRDCGLTTSDRVIRLFAEQLSREIRGTQVGARFGGAKFGIVLPEADPAAGLLLAEQVRRRFRCADWSGMDHGRPLAPLSVGFGGAALREGDTRATLLDRADQALISAQAAGADRSLIA